MIKLLEYMVQNNSSNLVKLDDFSFVVHQPTIGVQKIRTYLSKSIFVIILKGKKLVQTDSGEIIINTGECFFAAKGTYLISEKLSQENDFQSLIFFIDDSFLKQFIDKYLQLLFEQKALVSNPGIYKIIPCDTLRASLVSVLPYFSKEFSNKKELLKLKFEELLLHLINLDNSGQFVGFLKCIQSMSNIDLAYFMKENFYLPLTISEFASHTSRSLSVFKKEFKQIFNESPKKWINQQRLARAHQLFKDTDKNVTEICQEVGFDNVSHFIQLFKKKYGSSPKKLKTLFVG